MSEDTVANFSDKLEKWLEGSGPKTVASLSELFAAKSFAVIIFLLMIIPALPLPTGGITHIFEIVSMLLAIELIAGVKKVWIPKRWQKLKIAPSAKGKAVPRILGFIRWFERHSGSRWKQIFGNPVVTRLIGALILIFALAAFLAPPFSGLDTLPALGVVILCLAMVLEDSLLLLAGLITGAVGIGLIISLGSLAFSAIKHIF